MDIFESLENEKMRIVERLSDVSKNYSEWPRDRIFEETKRDFEELKNHFKKETILTQNLKDESGIKDILNTAIEQRKEITSEVESTVEIHVDEPGFEQALETIANKLYKYCQFCKDQFYPALKDKLTKTDLDHIESQLNQPVK